MKPAQIVSGICVAASVVCAGSIASGYGIKQHKDSAARLAKQCKNTINALDIKAQYEKTHPPPPPSIRKQSDESLKVISKAAK